VTEDISAGTIVSLVLAAIVAAFVLVVVFRAVRIVPQATAGIVERLGRYHKTLTPGLNILVPFIDRMRPLIDMREQVVSFPPQPVITEDNLVVSIDTVVYFQVTDARAATYEIRNYLGAVEQLTTTTLRNVVGGLNLEEALTSRDNINGQLRIVLDEATGKWGIRVGRVELKAIDPPHSIQDSMEKQMRAERDRRALILTAEGTKQSAILTAEGARQAAILSAEGEAQAQVLRAEGEAQAITTVFHAIHDGNPDDKLLAYQYLQMLPRIAEGPASKLWIVPSELTEALKGISGAFGPTVPPVAADAAPAAAFPPATEPVSSVIPGGAPPRTQPHTPPERPPTTPPTRRPPDPTGPEEPGQPDGPRFEGFPPKPSDGAAAERVDDKNRDDELPRPEQMPPVHSPLTSAPSAVGPTA
jgi:regulator of protease activity HflC (stomatin/prohibitin superfamily)